MRLRYTYTTYDIRFFWVWMNDFPLTAHHYIRNYTTQPLFRVRHEIHSYCVMCACMFRENSHFFTRSVNIFFSSFLHRCCNIQIALLCMSFNWIFIHFFLSVCVRMIVYYCFFFNVPPNVSLCCVYALFEQFYAIMENLIKILFLIRHCSSYAINGH